MGRRKIKDEDKRSRVQIECVVMTQVNNQYIWTCEKSGKVIARQEALRLTHPKYEEKAARRLADLKAVLEKHFHAQHR